MEIPNLLQALGERLQSGATVKNVFGEPVTHGDRVVIPVAKIAYGFGGGGGAARAKGIMPENEGGEEEEELRRSPRGS